MHVFVVYHFKCCSADLEKDHMCLLKKALLAWVQFKQTAYANK